ncbi:MAG: SUMF1/EgtB/PvdO family nonheme iron enzyme [Phycisphaerae bacterium]|nr:SUMF1/EgtB/PvdO family nonheme iron enzyme [Phycisphaerae bacterium]
MKKTIGLVIIMCTMTLANLTSAEIIRGIDIDFVTIGNAGNLGDTRPEAYPYRCGAVGYNYRIGEDEITNAQWNVFVTIAGTPTGNPSYAYDKSNTYTDVQQPANYISWYEAAQFCNYLTSGDKSLGAYQLGTDGSITIDRASAISTYSMVYVIPTEDEWYKAAYYKPDGSGYSLYANGTDIPPVSGVNTNYNNAVGSPWNVRSGTMEQNGTFDMMGNVWEWNETLFNNEPSYVLRGGCFLFNESYLSSSFRSNGWPYSEDEGRLGFRVASVPEPATILMLSLGGLALLRKRKR